MSWALQNVIYEKSQMLVLYVIVKSSVGIEYSARKIIWKKIKQMKLNINN